MYQKERLDGIIKILEEYGYVTVKFLTAALHYSNATINRDLNVLQKQKIIKRSYGGVELIEHKAVPLPFRYHIMKAEKRKIGRRAAEFIEDGDTVFIDGSTTCEYMADFLAEKSGVTVVTNNIALAAKLSEKGVTVICLGGKIVEPPSMLSGPDTVENAEKYHADKTFFSTGAIDEDGRIGTSDVYYLLLKTMVKNSDQIYYLVDHEKRHPVSKKYLFDVGKVDCVISDYDFGKELQKQYPDTKFELV